MGTATYSISQYGARNKSVRGAYVSGGSHTTSTSATDLTSGAAGSGSVIQAEQGAVLTIRVDEDVRIRFGGTDAATNEGHIVFANETADLEVEATGPISVIDVA